jgi:hypothetical protein
MLVMALRSGHAVSGPGVSGGAQAMASQNVDIERDSR